MLRAHLKGRNQVTADWSRLLVHVFNKYLQVLMTFGTGTHINLVLHELATIS